MRNQTAGVENRAQGRRKGREWELAGRAADDGRIEVDFDFVAFLDRVDRFWAGEGQQTVVDCVAVEDAPEAPSDNSADSVVDQARCGLLATRAAAPVAPPDEDVALLYLGSEIGIEILECVGGDLLR